MTREEIEKVNELAGSRGDLEKGALKFLGLKTAAGSEATVGGIVSEVDQWNHADDDARAGIEAYKGAKAPAADEPTSTGGEDADGRSDGENGTRDLDGENADAGSGETENA